MGKGKLEKFAEMAAFPHVFEMPFPADGEVALKGKWADTFFGNKQPVVLELGCGRGEYTVGLAERFPHTNYIGVDIKGARMWTGARQVCDKGLRNAGFLRTHIEFIDRFFAPNEVSELWLTFSDPQMKKPRKRLTSTHFLEKYRRFLADGGTIHLKTDSLFLFTYTRMLCEANHLPIRYACDDIYADETHVQQVPELSLQTYYEQQWLGRGICIKYIAFQLPQTGNLIEPDVEIPLDSYRSYNRQKRSEIDWHV